MPMGDGRCGVCGYWHAPGSEHIGRRPSYGICARCGNFHTEGGPCPQPEKPMRFPSRAEREAIGRRFEVRASAELHEMQQSEDRARAIIRQRLIEQAVRDVLIEGFVPEWTIWSRSRRAVFDSVATHIRTGVSYSMEECHLCGQAIRSIRARFRELANESAARSAAGR